MPSRDKFSAGGGGGGKPTAVGAQGDRHRSGAATSAVPLSQPLPALGLDFPDSPGGRGRLCVSVGGRGGEGVAPDDFQGPCDLGIQSPPRGSHRGRVIRGTRPGSSGMRVRALAGRQRDVPHVSVPTCQVRQAGRVRQREGQGSLRAASSQEGCPRYHSAARSPGGSDLHPRTVGA